MSNIMQFNNNNNKNLGLIIESIPDIPVTQKSYTTVEVSGGNSLTKFDKFLDNKIEVNMWFKCEDIDFMNKKAEISDWLLNIKDNKLKFSKWNGVFFKVKYVTIESITTTLSTIRKLKVTFNIEPFTFLDEKEIELDSPGTIYNPGIFETPATLIIKCSGDVTISMNNKNTILKDINEDTIIIDSELMNCYTESNRVKKNINNKISGYFPVFLPGDNNVMWEGSVERIIIKVRWLE